MLDGPVRPIQMDWEMERALVGLLRREGRQGLGDEPPLVYLDRSKRGHWMATGLQQYRWETPEGTIRLVKVIFPNAVPLDNFWAVRTVDYRRFYRLLRRQIRQWESHVPPILPPADQVRLWENTVGFLRHGHAELARYDVTPKRGVLLLGDPGNGKTMACRWLAAECRSNGLEWKAVTAEEYDTARADRNVPSLFQLESPGIILFDDFDTALRDRQTFGETDKHATFLSELDGLRQKSGIVFLFTSNAAAPDLDPAMRRPGRIDVVIEFPRPDASLRRRLIVERWHAEIQAGVDLAALVAETDGFSFAELEEVRKLLVLRRLDNGVWDWPWVRATLRAPDRGSRRSRPIGFQASQTADRAPTYREAAQS